MSAKAELIADLEQDRDRLMVAVRGMTPEQLEQGRYENGWNGRQILAHIAAIEWTYPRLLHLAKEAKPEVGESGRAEAQARDGMDGYNARQVEKRANASVDELLDEFLKNRAAFIAALEATDEALFERPIRSAGGRTGTLGQVLREVGLGHVRQHLADIVGE